MQPGDYILREDIKSKEHLEHIRIIVRELLGYQVSDSWGRWNSKRGANPHLVHSRSPLTCIILDRDGDLVWTEVPASYIEKQIRKNGGRGRRVRPSELGA